MTFKLSTVRMDLQAMEEGRDFEVVPGWTWKIRSHECKALKDYLAASEGKSLDDNEALAHGIVAGWSPVEDESGAPIQFTPENVLMVLSDPELAHIGKRVISEALTRDNYYKKSEQDSKNV